jgi:hypothetical protein
MSAMASVSAEAPRPNARSGALVQTAGVVEGGSVKRYSGTYAASTAFQTAAAAWSLRCSRPKVN